MRSSMVSSSLRIMLPFSDHPGHTHVLGAIIVVAVSVSACATQEGSVPQTSDLTISERPDALGPAAACERVLEAFGRRRFRCVVSPAATPPPITDYYRLQCASFSRAVDAGRVGFEPSNLDACIAEIDAS